METKIPRKRVRLLPLPAHVKVRSNDYYRLRFYWLGEIRWLRAKRRNGTATINDVKAAQRALAKVRLEP